MKKLTRLMTISATMILAACGGGDSKSETVKSDAPAAKRIAVTPEAKMIDTYLVSMDKMADAIEDVTDEASARKAAKQIAAIRDEMEKASEVFDDTKVSEQRAYMAMMSGPRRNELMQTQSRIAGSMMQLMTQPELMQIIQEEMDKMPQPGG